MERDALCGGLQLNGFMNDISEELLSRLDGNKSVNGAFYSNFVRTF